MEGQNMQNKMIWEIDSLVQASSVTKCKELFLITDCERETVQFGEDVVQIIPAYEWLLQPY